MLGSIMMQGITVLVIDDHDYISRHAVKHLYGRVRQAVIGTRTVKSNRLKNTPGRKMALYSSLSVSQMDGGCRRECGWYSLGKGHKKDL